MRIDYCIEGMHCASCIKKIKSALSSHVTVVEVTLNPPRLQIEVETPVMLDELNAYLSRVGNYHLQLIDDNKIDQSSVSVNRESQGGPLTYYPIFLIAIYIAGVAFINNIHGQEINWIVWMNQLMAGFFLVFSAFKFLDIQGFAEGYASYDLLARRWYSYGFIYPFLELGLGILYLGAWLPVITPILTIIIMGFSSLGVINSLVKKQKLQCACLGTILKVPLSSVTLTEDLAMVILASLTLMMQ